MGYKKDVWLQMFKHATEEPYAFMYLNSKKPKHLRIMKNFDTVLSHQADSDDEPEEKKRKIN